MKMSPEIIDAIKAAASKYKRQREFAEKIGAPPPTLSRWIHGHVEYIEDESWEKLYPHIRDHLKSDAAMAPARMEFLPVFALSGANVGSYPVIGGIQAELFLLVERDLFLQPEIRPRSIAAFDGEVPFSDLEDGEIVVSPGPPYTIGRWGHSPLPARGKYRRLLVNIAFVGDTDPKKCLAACHKHRSQA
jgi:hypothetical protein